MKKDLPLVELYSPMYRLVKYRTTTAATEREKESISFANDLANNRANLNSICAGILVNLWRAHYIYIISKNLHIF